MSGHWIRSNLPTVGLARTRAVPGYRAPVQPDPVTFGQQLADGFALGPVVSLQAGGVGANGRIWRLRTETDDVAVKQLFGGPEAAALDPVAVREVAFAEAGRVAGVLAPRQRTDRFGRFASRASTGTVRVADWVEGTAVRPSDLAAAAWAGWVMATLLGLGFPVGTDEVDRWYTVPATEERWETLVRAADRAGASWSVRLRRQVPELLNLVDLVGRVDASGLAWCHTDIQAQNAVRRPDGRYELLDWDEAGPVVPVYALARLLVDWSVDWTDEGTATVYPDRLEAVLRGYRSGGGTSVPRSVDDFGGLVAGTLNFLAGQAELALGAGYPTDLRATGDAQVRRLLRHPLTRATLDRVADLVRAA